LSRIVQRRGERGSLKWIQACVNTRPHILDAAILAQLPMAKSIEWRSPLESDDFAEYRDALFLAQLDLDELAPDLAAFWPDRGPQWDALGITDAGHVLLVEAKAHIDELCSPPSAAKAERSTALIKSSLAETTAAFGATPKADWSNTFYQYANRLAHLHFLCMANIHAWLVLVNFVGDAEMNGPDTRQEWEAAYRIVNHVMGIRERTRLMRRVLHVYPDVKTLA